MSFNIGHALVSAAESFVTSGGNPIAAGVGAVEGGCSGNQTTAQPTVAGFNPAELLEGALGQQPDITSSINQLSNLAKNDFSIIGGGN